MIFGSNRWIDGFPSFCRKRSSLKRTRGYDTEEEGGGSRFSFAR